LPFWDTVTIVIFDDLKNQTVGATQMRVLYGVMDLKSDVFEFGLMVYNNVSVNIVYFFLVR
jgi:hypothetical protein